jgi:2',3'-cyclic-nucleotide 2'-phosphodiesterase (5'-nucleotidase family)
MGLKFSPGKKSFKFSFAGRIMLLMLALWFLASGISHAAENRRPILVIYHTNDVHGYVSHETDKDGHPTRWGYDYVKTVVDKDPAYNKILLDAGDVLSGQVFATARKGELVARMLAMMRYDAIAAGNHDFDYGWERLLSLRDIHGLNFISANVTENLDDRHIMLSYVARNFPNLKVGIFGLSTPATTTTTDPRNVKALSFAPTDETISIAKEMVRRLREHEEADMVIALTHLGSESYCDPSSRALAREVPGIDLIIDGHSHSELDSGLKVGNTVIASTGSNLVNLGRIEVFRVQGGGYEFNARLLPAADSEHVTPKPELSSALEILKDELNRELSDVAAYTPIDLDGARERIRYGSTNMGRLVCASLMAGTGADAAIINSGSIRDSIPAGSVTKGALLSVMPYGNYAYTVEMTGQDVLDALNTGLSRPGSGSFPQFYGIAVAAEKIETRLPDGTVSEALTAKEVTIGGKALDKNATYKVAINDFMYRGGDNYTMFAKYSYSEFGTLDDMFRKFMSETHDEAIRSIDETVALTVE